VAGCLLLTAPILAVLMLSAGAFGITASREADGLTSLAEADDGLLRVAQTGADKPESEETVVLRDWTYTGFPASPSHPGNVLRDLRVLLRDLRQLARDLRRVDSNVSFFFQQSSSSSFSQQQSSSSVSQGSGTSFSTSSSSSSSFLRQQQVSIAVQGPTFSVSAQRSFSSSFSREQETSFVSQGSGTSFSTKSSSSSSFSRQQQVSFSVQQPLHPFLPVQHNWQSRMWCH